MKHIAALVGLLTVLSVLTLRLSAQACQVSLGTYAPPGAIRSIAVEGTTGAAYDVQRNNILILDLTDPSRPAQRSVIASFEASDLAISRQVLYVVNGSGAVWLFDLADLRAPALITSFSGFSSLDRIDVDGGLAIVRDKGNNNFVSLDVSNSSNVQSLGVLRYPAGTNDAALIGSTMYLTTDSDEIRTYSLKQRDRITFVSSARFTGKSLSRVDADGKLLLALDSKNRASVLFDTTSGLAMLATNPSALSFYLALSGCTQYLASGTMEASNISACGNGLCTTADNSLSFLGGRFSVRVDWADSAGNKGIGHAVRLTDAAGYFWFFDPANAEVQVKLLDACVEPFNRFWFFGAGLTNVEVKLEVTDLKTGRTFRYTNPQGTPFAPIQDTSGIDVCP